MNQSASTPPVQKLQFWIIWFAILGGLPMMIFFVQGGWPQGSDEGEASLILRIAALSGVFVSAVVRWIVLPRIHSAKPLLTTMVIGLALAEATAFLGMFLIGDEFPETQALAYTASFLGMLQFLPTYAKNSPQE